MILQRIWIIGGVAGFEPRTSALEVWCATIEPPHLQGRKEPDETFRYKIFRNLYVEKFRNNNRVSGTKI